LPEAKHLDNKVTKLSGLGVTLLVFSMETNYDYKLTDSTILRLFQLTGALWHSWVPCARGKEYDCPSPPAKTAELRREKIGANARKKCNAFTSA